jgi:hypothetical protein
LLIYRRYIGSRVSTELCSIFTKFQNLFSSPWTWTSTWGAVGRISGDSFHHQVHTHVQIDIGIQDESARIFVTSSLAPPSQAHSRKMPLSSLFALRGLISKLTARAAINLQVVIRISRFISSGFWLLASFPDHPSFYATIRTICHVLN